MNAYSHCFRSKREYFFNIVPVAIFVASSATYRKDFVREAVRRDAYARRTLKSRGRSHIGSWGEFPW